MSSSSFGGKASAPVGCSDTASTAFGLKPLAPIDTPTTSEPDTRFFNTLHDYAPAAGPDALPTSSFASLGPSTSERASFSRAAGSSFGLTSAPTPTTSVAQSSPFATANKSFSSHTCASSVPFGKTSAEAGPSTSSGSFWFTRREAPLSLGAPVASPATKPSQILLKGDDILSKAVNRAVSKRKAVFGLEDMGADEAMASYLTRMGAPNISVLVNELSAVAQTSPAAMEFLRHTFKASVQSSLQLQRSANINTPQRATFSVGDKKYHLTPPDQVLDVRISTECHQYGWPSAVSDFIVGMILDGRALLEIRRELREKLEGYGYDTGAFDGFIEFMQDQREDWFGGISKELPAHTFFLPTKQAEQRLADLPKGTYDGFKGREQASIDGFSSCCPNTNAKLATKVSGGKPPSFLGLLELPAELRMWVLKSALSPGYVSLRSCGHHNPAITVPNVCPALLCTSKQIQHEAKDLLLENTFIVNVWVDNSSCAVIHPKQLPDHILPLIKNLTIVFDYTPMISTAARERDWRPFQRMTGLQNLRICAIDTTESTRGYYSRIASIYMNCIKEVKERIPKDCVVSYGPEVKAEEDHISDMIKTLVRHSRQSASSRDPSSSRYLSSAHKPSSADTVRGCYSMDGKNIEACAKALADETVQGCKSGSAMDWRYVRKMEEAD